MHVIDQSLSSHPENLKVGKIRKSNVTRAPHGSSPRHITSFKSCIVAASVETGVPREKISILRIMHKLSFIRNGSGFLWCATDVPPAVNGS